jgi:hypothetical protein
MLVGTVVVGMLVGTVVVAGSVVAGSVVDDAEPVVVGAAGSGDDVAVDVEGAVLEGAVVVVEPLDPDEVAGMLIGPAGSVGSADGAWAPKATGLFALPAALCTATVPAVDPAGTVAVTSVNETCWNGAGIPLKVTLVNL